MSLLGYTGPRRRFLLAYGAVLVVAAAGLAGAWPAHRGAIAATAATALLTAWVVVRVTYHRLHERLHELREATDAISRGDLTRRIKSPPRDDFIKLAESLDRMTTQLKQHVQEQERLRQELTRSEKLAVMGELAATVAHEINNPLDGLQNCTRIIRRNLDNASQVRQLLDLMDAGLYRIEMIVRRLLTMSHDEPVRLVPTRVDEIVNDAVLFVRPRLERRSIEFVHQCPEPPLFAQADRIQLAQALINLMINAADSIPHGGQLTVTCRGDECGQKVLLSVTDTGTGVDAEHLLHIFEPFYTTKSGGGGTGLGLAIVARIVEAHHGRIEVSSEVGRGTRFDIELPASPSVPKLGERPALSVPTPLTMKASQPAAG